MFDPAWRCPPTQNPQRKPINIDPAVRDRLRRLLHEPEFRAVGYSAFINRACELAEGAIARHRTGRS